MRTGVAHEVLHQAVSRAKIERSEKIRALKRLAGFTGAPHCKSSLV
jgi:hypothetical protein